MINKSLIFRLSLFGLAMAFATLYFVPTKAEFYFWIPIFLISAWLIAKYAGGKYFLTGFLTGLANCIWITLVHGLMFSTYLENHPDASAMFAQSPMPTHPRIFMLIVNPVIGVISGLVLGLFALIASKIMKSGAPQSA